MKRVRISTTVDSQRLERCRAALRLPDSLLVDRALAALLEEVEKRRELEALTAHPYDDDPELAWSVADGPSLPYDGDVPAEVLRLAAARREQRGDP